MKRVLMFLIVGGAVAQAGLAGGAARADVIFGASDAYALSTDLTLTLTPGGVNVAAVINPIAESSGTAPSPFSYTMHLVTLNTSAGAYALSTASVVTATTGIIDSLASSTVDGSPGSKNALGTVTIHNLNLSTITSLTSGLLGITADTIVSTSSVTGDFGSFTAVGSTVLTNAHFTVLGIAQAALASSPAPNTSLTLAGIANVSIILNEQILGGNGSSASLITTNAIHVHFNGTSITGLGTLSGDIIVGHSIAHLRAIPEPGSLALLGLGGVGMLFHVRRHRAKARA